MKKKFLPRHCEHSEAIQPKQTFLITHWFGILMSMFVIIIILYCTAILLSPRVDSKNRGFIPCSQKLLTDIYSCQNKVGCTIKAALNNTACDFKIMGQGISLWIKGEQGAPWSNYIFEPENSELRQDLEQIKKLNKELENEEE